MKQYLFFTSLIFFIVIGCIFFLEKTDFLHLRELDISAKVYEEDGTVTLKPEDVGLTEWQPDGPACSIDGKGC